MKGKIAGRGWVGGGGGGRADTHFIRWDPTVDVLVGVDIVRWLLPLASLAATFAVASAAAPAAVAVLVAVSLLRLSLRGWCGCCWAAWRPVA